MVLLPMGRVGLIAAAQGATAIESWMSGPSLYGPNGTTADSHCPDYLDGDRGSDTRAPALPPGAIPPNSASPPTSNFNGQIAPLTRMSIKGVVWCGSLSHDRILTCSTRTRLVVG